MVAARSAIATPRVPARTARARPSPRLLLVATMLAMLMLVGGGGSPAPRAELAAQLVALCGFAAWQLLSPARPARLDPLVLAAMLLLATLPLIQLVPLPPQLWHALPGRGAERAALRLAGAEHAWMPLSLTPAGTFAAALSLIPPLVVFGMVARLAPAERSALLGIVVVGATLSAVVGVVQLAGGTAGTARLYGSTGASYASGLFANRNAAADLLLVGLVAMTALAPARPELLRPQSARMAWAALALFLLLSVVLTRSRAGTLLAVVPLAAALFAARPLLRAPRRGLLVAAALVATLAVGALHGNAVLQHSWQRFALAADDRANLRADTRYAITRSWPVGTGIGSFVPVFIAAERLDSVDATRPNRAHNDYLEFTLEAGAAAPALLFAAAGAIAWRVASLLRTPSAERGTHLLFALGTLAIFALHALVDYPMRAITLACLAALAIGLLADPPEEPA